MNWSERLSLAGGIAKAAGLILFLVILCVLSLIGTIIATPAVVLFLICFGLSCRY
jgi:hypothetical protein